MPHIPKNETGVLFQNRFKKSDRSPDWTGEGMFNDKRMRLAGWYKTGASGQFLSLKISDFEAGFEVKQPVEVKPKGNDPFDDNSVPF